MTIFMICAMIYAMSIPLAAITLLYFKDDEKWEMESYFLIFTPIVNTLVALIVILRIAIEVIF